MARDNLDYFDAFVKRQQVPKPEEEPIDWDAVRDRWLSDLRELYSKVESLLAKYISTGEIAYEYRDHNLNEENIGAYMAPMMILRIGRQKITLTPVGTLLIGARGRVDVVGPAGSTRFMLVNRAATKIAFRVTVVSPGAPKKEEEAKEIHWAWKIATKPPDVRFIDLTQESLFQALLEVANG
jgi:hypothetical protein